MIKSNFYKTYINKHNSYKKNSYNIINIHNPFITWLKIIIMKCIIILSLITLIVSQGIVPGNKFQVNVVRGTHIGTNTNSIGNSLTTQCLSKMYSMCTVNVRQAMISNVMLHYCCQLWDVIDCYQRNYKVSSVVLKNLLILKYLANYFNTILVVLHKRRATDYSNGLVLHSTNV